MRRAEPSTWTLAEPIPLIDSEDIDKEEGLKTAWELA